MCARPVSDHCDLKSCKRRIRPRSLSGVLAGLLWLITTSFDMKVLESRRKKLAFHARIMDRAVALGRNERARMCSVFRSLGGIYLLSNRLLREKKYFPRNIVNYNVIKH